MSVGADKFQMWNRRKAKTETASAAPLASAVSTCVQCGSTMIKQEKTSKIKSKNIQFGVVLGVVEKFLWVKGPPNKGYLGTRFK